MTARFTMVTLADLDRRGSWLHYDFIYQQGERVNVHVGDTLARAVVVGQEGRAVRVSFVDNVPGSGTEFCCSVPVAVSLFDIQRAKVSGPTRARGVR